jgi:rod shape-determining protein MreC
VSRRSARPRFVLAVLVLAAITLVTIDSRGSGNGVLDDIRGRTRDVFSPIQHATHTVLEPIGNFLSGTIHYGSLRKENERLRQDLTALQGQAMQSEAEQAEAEQVLKLADLPFLNQIPTVDAAVIDEGADNFETTITIDKGSGSGIAVGQPVVAATGLVGTVAEVGKDSATIALLTDPTVAVGVRLDPHNTGSAEGSGRGRPLRVTIDTPQEPVPQLTKGQSVVTSGLNLEKFPPGIPIGTVESDAVPPGGVEPDIELNPLVDLESVSAVAVLLWSPQ